MVAEVDMAARAPSIHPHFGTTTQDEHTGAGTKAVGDGTSVDISRMQVEGESEGPGKVVAVLAKERAKQGSPRPWSPSSKAEGKRRSSHSNMVVSSGYAADDPSGSTSSSSAGPSISRRDRVATTGEEPNPGHIHVSKSHPRPLLKGMLPAGHSHQTLHPPSSSHPPGSHSPRHATNPRPSIEQQRHSSSASGSGLLQPPGPSHFNAMHRTDHNRPNRSTHDPGSSVNEVGASGSRNPTGGQSQGHLLPNSRTPEDQTGTTSGTEGWFSEFNDPSARTQPGHSKSLSPPKTSSDPPRVSASFRGFADPKSKGKAKSIEDPEGESSASDSFPPLSEWPPPRASKSPYYPFSSGSLVPDGFAGGRSVAAKRPGHPRSGQGQMHMNMAVDVANQAVDRMEIEMDDDMRNEERSVGVDVGSAGVGAGEAVSAESFRDIVDDLTIQNQMLRGRLRRYEVASVSKAMKRDRLFEVRFFDGLSRDHRVELESFLTSFVQSLNPGSSANSHPSASTSSGASASPLDSRSEPSPASFASTIARDKVPTGVASEGHTSPSGDEVSGNRSGSGGEMGSDDHGLGSSANENVTGGRPKLPTLHKRSRLRYSYGEGEEKNPKKDPTQNVTEKDRLAAPSNAGYEPPSISGTGTGYKITPPHNSGNTSESASSAQGPAPRKEADNKESRERTKSLQDFIQMGGNALDHAKMVAETVQQLFEESLPGSKWSKARSGRPQSSPPLDPTTGTNQAYLGQLIEHASVSGAGGWVYLNLAFTMAELHRLNVTLHFVRTALRAFAPKLEVSADGTKVRWRDRIAWPTTWVPDERGGREYAPSASRSDTKEQGLLRTHFKASGHRDARKTREAAAASSDSLTGTPEGQQQQVHVEGSDAASTNGGHVNATSSTTTPSGSSDGARILRGLKTDSGGGTFTSTTTAPTSIAPTKNGNSVSDKAASNLEPVLQDGKGGMSPLNESSAQASQSPPPSDPGSSPKPRSNHKAPSYIRLADDWVRPPSSPDDEIADNEDSGSNPSPDEVSPSPLGSDDEKGSARGILVYYSGGKFCTDLSAEPVIPAEGKHNFPLGVAARPSPPGSHIHDTADLSGLSVGPLSMSAEEFDNWARKTAERDGVNFGETDGIEAIYFSPERFLDADRPTVLALQKLQVSGMTDVVASDNFTLVVKTVHPVANDLPVDLPDSVPSPAKKRKLPAEFDVPDLQSYAVRSFRGPMTTATECSGTSWERTSLVKALAHSIVEEKAVHHLPSIRSRNHPKLYRFDSSSSEGEGSVRRVGPGHPLPVILETDFSDRMTEDSDYNLSLSLPLYSWSPHARSLSRASSVDEESEDDEAGGSNEEPIDLDDFVDDDVEDVACGDKDVDDEAMAEGP